MDRIISLLCLGTISLLGQTNSITASFSDPDRPGTVKLQHTNGSVTIRGYSGKNVIIESRPGHRKNHRIEARVKEEGNRMTINSPSNEGIVIQVPMQTSLQLNATNGSILVERVLGELDVQSTNGSIVLRGVAGAVVAHSQNGSITTTFDKVDARRPMSFSSMNGKIDVAFPADLKATFKVQDERGSVHSDFDLLMRGGGSGKLFTATVNGGGPEIQFKSYNGGIYIRRAGK